MTRRSVFLPQCCRTAAAPSAIRNVCISGFTAQGNADKVPSRETMTAGRPVNRKEGGNTPAAYRKTGAKYRLRRQQNCRSSYGSCPGAASGCKRSAPAPADLRTKVGDSPNVPTDMTSALGQGSTRFSRTNGSREAETSSKRRQKGSLQQKRFNSVNEKGNNFTHKRGSIRKFSLHSSGGCKRSRGLSRFDGK